MRPFIERSDMPGLLRLLTYSGTTHLWGRTVAGAVVLFLITTVLAASNGQLILAEDAAATAICDFRVILPSACTNTNVAEMPLSRDYASLWHLFMIAYISAHLWRLIDAQRNLIVTLSATGVVSSNRVRLRERSRQMSARISAARTNRILVTLALLCGVLGYTGYALTGIYPALVGGQESAAEIAFKNWWVEGSILTRLWFQVVAFIGNYINLWALYILLESCFFYMFALRHCEWRLVTAASDGRWGWGPVYELIRVGVSWLTVTGVGLIGIVLIVHPQGSWFLLAFPAIFVLALVPVALVNRFYLAARKNRAYLHLIESPTLRRLEDISLHQAPDRLIPFSRLLTQALIGLLPLLLALYDLTKGSQ